jgi:hypothetical protein
VASPKCSAGSATSSGVTLSDPRVATMVPGMFGNNATVDIEAGKDVYAGYLDFFPGFRSGWLTHLPAANIVSGGELTYLMALDGKCDTSDRYHAGQGFYHPAHRHMAMNNGSEHVLLTTMYFDLPHDIPVPVIGNTIEADDFTQAPPADCLQLF